MWRLIIFLLLLVASVWVGIEVARHPGFLFIAYEPWMVQMPIWFALLALLIFLCLFYFLIHIIDGTQFLWFKFKNWLRFRREQKFYTKTQHGLTLLIESRFKKAERFLLAGVNQTAEPLINYLGAAKAAQEQNAYQRRDQYIQKAYEIAPQADLAIGITKAELEFEQGQFEQTIATLNHLRQISPRHPRVLSLLEKVYVRLGDWKALQAILPSLRKAKVLTDMQLEQFEKNLYCERFHSPTIISLDDVNQIWQEIPRYLRKNPDIVFAYSRQLIHFSATKEAEDLIRKTLKNQWHAGLANLYGNLPFTNLNRQLVIAGAWLKMYGPKPELLLLLGKLCVRIQLWGKAKDYFEKCLAQGPNAEASLEYGNLLMQLDEPQEAMQKYKQGLERIVLIEKEKYL